MFYNRKSWNHILIIFLDVLQQNEKEHILFLAKIKDV